MKTKKWPVYYAEQLDVGDAKSCRAVCTAWTPRRAIVRRLPVATYSIVGNLYSRDGLNGLVRNILANPAIRHILVCGRELTDSIDALFALIENGINAEWRVVGNGAQMDRELPRSAIDRVRRGIRLHDLRGTTDFSVIAKAVHQLPTLPPFGNPKVYPIRERTVEVLPSEEAGCLIRGETLREVWLQMLSAIMAFGRVTHTDYGDRQKEVVDLLGVLEIAGESGMKVPSWIPVSQSAVRNYEESFLAKDAKAGLSYSYGHRLRAYWKVDQIEGMVRDLQRSRLSRRAVATLWDPTTDSESKDPPCVDLLQAMIRENKIHLTAYIRSNDIYRAWPLNAVGLRRLQIEIARRLGGTLPGHLVTLSKSAHIYEDCWVQAEESLTRRSSKRFLDGTFRQDPRGSFVIRVSEGRIIADHYSPDGDRLMTVSEKTARGLERKLSQVVSYVDHAMYLGRELARAEMALKQGRSYEQDRI